MPFINKIILSRCEFCDTVFSCSDGLNEHRPSHVGEKPYSCHICGSSFHTYSRVTTHKTTHGIYDQIEPQEGDFTIPRHFLCEHCGKYCLILFVLKYLLSLKKVTSSLH